MFTESGFIEYEKHRKWISDEDYMLSPNFVPTDETPQEAIDYYKRMEASLVDFDAPDFKWPTGVGMNF